MLAAASIAASIAIGAPWIVDTLEVSKNMTWVVSAAGAAVTVFFMLCYIGSVHPFWRITSAPSLKPFVFFVRMCVFIAIALACVALYFVAMEHGNLVTPLLAVAVVCGAAGSYDAYVWHKSTELRRKTRSLTGKAESSDDMLDTHGFVSNSELLEDSRQAGDGKVFLGSVDDRAIFCKPAHLITYGGPGSGKGTSVVIPNLFAWKGSVFVTDPKGENASITARFRRDRLGHRVRFLNPWGLNGFPNHSFNPLEMVKDAVANNRNPNAESHLKHQELDDADAITKLMIPDPPTRGDNDWVRRLARELLKTFILYLAYDQPENCNLPTVLKCLKLPEDEYLKHFKRMIFMPPVMRGELHGLANKIIDDYQINPKQHFAGRDEAIQALSIFADYGALGRSTKSSSFSLREFVESGTQTIYLILPLKHVRSHGAWAGLVTANVFEAINTYGRGTPVLALLDEFANLGKLQMIDKLTGYRGHGLRAWLIVQSHNQLQAVYGDAEANGLREACSVEQYIQVSGEPARQLSERLGHKTVKVSTEAGLESQYDETYHAGGRSTNVYQKPRMSQAELENLGNDQLVIIEGKPSIITKQPYWNLEPCRTAAGHNPLHQQPLPLAKHVIDLSK